MSCGIPLSYYKGKLLTGFERLVLITAGARKPAQWGDHIAWQEGNTPEVLENRIAVDRIGFAANIFAGDSMTPIDQLVEDILAGACWPIADDEVL